MKCFDVSVSSSIIITSIPFIFSTFYNLSLLFYIFTNSNNATVLAMITFLLFGGRGYIKLFDKDAIKNRTTEFIMNWGSNRNEFCMHPLLQMIIPQRSTLNLPIGFPPFSSQGLPCRSAYSR